MTTRKHLKYLNLFILLLVLFLQIEAVDITLTSTMSDTAESTYSISNNVLTLSSDNEEYSISGTCNECQINVAKDITATIKLNSIQIDNSATGPFVIKKNAVVNLVLEGESTITDKETDESSSDFEGAGIKFKSSSSLTISGSGKLNVISTIKNGIKGAAKADLIINGGTLNVSAVNNGIASDNSVTITGGTFTINTSEGDGLKSDPDDDDTESNGKITIIGGSFNINSYNDGIQAKKELIINGGTFNIKTYKDGSSSSNFNKDDESAKGIKCSANTTNSSNLVINGGNYILNTADDSIHSNGNLTITGGTFEISSGDDAVHADQNLYLGKEKADNSLINMKITKSYEGLEGSNIYIYSGTYSIISSDDGINSAGDTDQECQPGQPGRGNGGNPPSPPRGRQNFLRRTENKYPHNLRNKRLAECYSFHIYIYGGEIFVNAESDGFDANGNIVIFGGNITVWGAKSGVDGDPIDLDGALTITGGTVFAGGNRAMTQIDRVASNSQNYIYSTNSYNANYVLNIYSGESIIRTITVPKNVQYLYYTSPNVDSTYSFSGGSTNSGFSTNEPINRISSAHRVKLSTLCLLFLIFIL